MRSGAIDLPVDALSAFTSAVPDVTWFPSLPRTTEVAMDPALRADVASEMCSSPPRSADAIDVRLVHEQTNRLASVVVQPGECPYCPPPQLRPHRPTTSRPCPPHAVLAHLAVMRRSLTTPARTPEAEALRKDTSRYGETLRAIATQGRWTAREWALAYHTLATEIATDPIASAAPVICYALEVCAQAAGTPGRRQIADAHIHPESLVARAASHGRRDAARDHREGGA